MTDLPTISVVVPVWNDADRIKLCLGSLGEQTYPRERTEVIVIDNGSCDDSAAIASSFPFVRVFTETQPGSYCARNRGLAIATGEFVAFIDADCQATPAWLAAMVSAFQCTENAGIVAGRIELLMPVKKSGSPAALYESLFAFKQRSNAARGQCVTANWLSARALLLAYGGFDAQLKSGADTCLSRRIARDGHKVVYAPDAVVRHPARETMIALAAKRRRLIGGTWSAASGKLPRPINVGLDIARRFVGEALSLRRRTKVPIRHRLLVFCALCALAAVSAFEVVRLEFGGEPRR